jgi:ketosteroid isomerase-like protein
MQTTCDLNSLAVRYIELVGEKQYDGVAELLAPDVSFKGPFTTVNSSDAFIASLRHMAPVWERNSIRAAFSEGDQACVIYDFVSNTQTGAVPCIELLTFNDEKIQSVELFFDRAAFAPAGEALAKLAGK